MPSPGDHWPERRSIRLAGFDYARPGAYFVTICVRHQRPLLGSIRDGVLRPSAAGEMVAAVWAALPLWYPGVHADAFVAMPDHVHGIVFLHRLSADPLSLSDVVHRFKSLTTARYREGVQCFGWPAFDGRLWHRNYYERIIRGARHLAATRRYILLNPIRWRR